jgi:hypothetical protein
VIAQTVGWAKRPVRRSSTSEGGSVPTIHGNDLRNGEHGAKPAFAYPTIAKEPAK